MDWLLRGDSSVTFTINGTVYHAGPEDGPETSLNTYIREYANLKGTKYMCREGGCGACIVTMTTKDPSTGHDRSYAVNSCLVSILSCQGAAITTIEGIGNKRKGYHKVQKALYTFNGTQCGYCSPGQVMNMYSLLQSNPYIKMADVENSFGGSICRCTGYRPILDAFKSLASDATPDLKDKLAVIEDLVGKCTIKCKKDCKECHKVEDDNDRDYSELFLETAMAPKNLQLSLKTGVIWYRVTEIPQVFQLFDLIDGATYMLVAGNTSQGVYRPTTRPSVYIDINDIPELKTAIVYTETIVLGGNITLTDMISLFQKVSTHNPLFYGYTKGLADHIDLVANVPVRNIATLAGNLMIKHQHREFPSDLFLILETCGARITIRDLTGNDSTVPLLDFLDMNMDRKLIVNVIVPALSNKHYIFRSFKIMPRRQNVHAYVNAGFLFRFQWPNRCIVEERPTMVFGHISPAFAHPYETEEFLIGKSLLDPAVFNVAKLCLAREIKPHEESPEEASVTYRKKLAIALFYKFILGVNGDYAAVKFRSGGPNLIRPLSSGKQDFPTIEKEAPVHLPKQKVEGLIQCSGEAEYIDDMPYIPGQFHGAFVIADRARAKILSVDASPATSLPGVEAFFSAKDIQGVNSYTIVDGLITLEDIELFCSGDIKYAGQPIGIIVANTQDLADKAAKLVKVNYSTVTKPLITIKDVLDSGDKSRIKQMGRIDPVGTPGKPVHKIFGEYEMGSQYHYTMELQTCVCIPKEDGMDVYSSTQWMHNVQAVISKLLGTQLNSINVQVKRVGGAYGARITNSTYVAGACALAAHILQKPVRTVINLETTTKAFGKRCRFLLKYEVGVDEKGAIQSLKADLYEDMGCGFSDNVIIFTMDGVKNCYDVSKWTVNCYLVKTDVASTTWTRAPGTLEGMAAIEHIMEHIAAICKLDPLSVRRVNFADKSSTMMEEVLQEALQSSDYDKRMSSINKYNVLNRWRKRGLSVMAMKFDLIFFPGFHSTVSIFYDDGTVAISSGGIEIGQGINTKVVQMCAYMLGIDMSMIKIKPCYNMISPNDKPTSASIGTDTITYATMKCCEELNRRLLPIRQKMDNPSWVKLVTAANTAGVDLKASYMYSVTDAVPKPYSVYGATVLEVEVDILTGQYQVVRADIVEDAGESLNPLLDIGQIEGAFTMGLGYLSSERVVYDSNDGALRTTRTWRIGTWKNIIRKDNFIQRRRIEEIEVDINDSMANQVKVKNKKKNIYKLVNLAILELNVKTYWPPGAKDIPIDFRVTIKKNASNPVGVLRSKATGEPPLCMSLTLVNALRQVLVSARKDAGLKDEWFRFDPPCTFENTFLTSGTSIQHFLL